MRKVPTDCRGDSYPPRGVLPHPGPIVSSNGTLLLGGPTLDRVPRRSRRRLSLSSPTLECTIASPGRGFPVVLGSRPFGTVFPAARRAGWEYGNGATRENPGLDPEPRCDSGRTHRDGWLGSCVGVHRGRQRSELEQASRGDRDRSDRARRRNALRIWLRLLHRVVGLHR